MNIIDEIRNDRVGAATLLDWWGSGLRHVPQHLADHRSLACIHGNAGNPCPNNKSPNWWEKHFKDPIAKAITSELELKYKMNLNTPFDDRMAMCGACGCCLPLKVWTPIEHIRKHLTDAQLDKMPPYCWMRKEMAIQ